MNSRISGDIFEYYVVYVLNMMRVKTHNKYTIEKSEKLLYKMDIGTSMITIGKRLVLFKKISRFVKTIGLINTYELINEHVGSIGDATDIRCWVANVPINISLKRNNHSIKHQRPSNLGRQLQMTVTVIEYNLRYKNLNDKWFKLFNVDKFSEISKIDKFRMYTEFNNLYAHYININQDCRYQYINFLLANNIQNKYIMEWKDTKNHLLIYDCKTLNYPDVMYAEVDGNNIILEFFIGDDLPYITLKLRLHNASKYITNSLSLKYDTTIIDIKNIYKTTII